MTRAWAWAIPCLPVGAHGHEAAQCHHWQNRWELCPRDSTLEKIPEDKNPTISPLGWDVTDRT